MKLALGMESEKSAPVKVQEKMDQPKNTRHIWKLVIGLTGVVIVAAVVLVSVYFGIKLTRENYVEARQVFRTGDGKVVEEETTIAEKEVNIRIPNQKEIVYDYKSGLVIERYVDSETKEKSACYARYMNETESPSNNVDDYKDEEVTLGKSTHESDDGEEERWKSTSRKVSKQMVSERAVEMCKDTDIFMMEKVTSDQVSKRATCVYAGYTYVCVKLQPRCLYRCKYEYYCRIGNKYYLFRRRTAYMCRNNCRGYNKYCR